MFDALKFDVAMVTESGFERLDQSIHYTYAWRYEYGPANEKEEKRFSDDFMRALLTQTVVFENEIEDYVPRYANPAINFATEDMGSYMVYFQILCILLSAVLIYLLTKIIIEKNESAISMTKILGYENREIASLYLLSTTMILIVSDVVSVILGAIVMTQAWRVIMSGNSGWFAFVIEPAGYVKMFLFVLIGYLFVMILDFARIKKIPMGEALKSME